MSEAEDVVQSVSEAPMSSDEVPTGTVEQFREVCRTHGVELIGQGWEPPKLTTIVVPQEELPALDPGAFCKPRTPDKPKGATSYFGQFELPPGPDLGAFKKAMTPTNLPPGVQQIADNFSWEGPRDRDKPHPIQLAREHKAASEPPRPSGNAERPGFRFSQEPKYRQLQVSWSSDWDRQVNKLVAAQLDAFEKNVRKQQVRETRLAYQTELEKTRVADLVQREFQRLAEARAAEDAKVVEEHQKALAAELRQLEAVRFQQRLFACLLFVGFVVVVYAGWWVQ